LEGELDSLRDRYTSAAEELASTSDDRVRLTEQIDQLKQQMHKMSDEKTAAQRSTMKQVTLQVSLHHVAFPVFDCP